MIEFSERIATRLHKLQLGILTFKGAIQPSSEKFWELVDSESKKIREHIKSDEITKIPTIASTREGYKVCGKDPSRYRPSADSLVRRIIKGNDLYKVNNVVDVLNLISLRTGYSIGGYNFSKISGKVQLDIGTAEDRYVGIGRGELNIEGLPVLRDSEGPFGSPTSDSERTMISEEATDLLFVFFDFGPHNELEDWMNKTIKLLEEFCGARDFSKETTKI